MRADRVPAPVPLPASVVLLGAALAGLAGLRRVRRTVEGEAQ